MEFDWLGWPDIEEYIRFRRPEAQGGERLEKFRKELDWYLKHPWGPDRFVGTMRVEGGGTVGGQVIALPARLWASGQEVTSCWAVDTYTSPDFRKRGIASTIIENLCRAHPFLIAPGSNAASVRRYGGDEYAQIGRFFRYIGVVNPGRFLRYYESQKSILKFFRPVSFLFPKPKIPQLNRNIQVEKFDEFGSEFDVLWNEIKDTFKVTPFRTSEWLQWRFDQCPHRKYHRLKAVKNGKLSGYAVMRWFDREGFRLGFLTDIFADMKDKETVYALLDAVLKTCRDHKLDFLSVIASSCEFEKRLKECRFFRITYDSFNTIKRQPQEGALNDILCERDNWFITLADADYDLNIRPLEQEELFST